MHYPYLIYNSKVEIFPVFPNLQGQPYIADMSPVSPLLMDIEVRDQRALQKLLEKEMGIHFSWGLSSYLERRDTLLGDCPQMVEEQRFIHLGVDIIVDLGTPLHAPLDGIVCESGYESGEGNYGGHVLLRHESPHFDTFYSFYGHLCRSKLPEAGAEIAGGEPFAEIGDFHENGNWFYHTHLQIITELGFAEGYISKGYCSENDLLKMDKRCPSPLHLLVVGS